MKKAFKWIGISLAGLVGVIILVAVVLSFAANARLNKTHNVQPAAVSIPDDDSDIDRGAYIYASSCAGCHGEDLSGTVILDDPAIGYVPAPNLTSGQGGAVNAYTDRDYVRAIRHGVGPDEKALMIMPSKAYWYFSDDDLGALIAYVKTAPPVDNELGEKAIKPLGRVLLSLGAFGDVFAAEVLDHSGPRPPVPDQGVTAAYGEYLVNTGDCKNCHGPDLAGAQSPEPGAPFSPNLTPGGTLGIWSPDDFIAMMETGITPYGRQLDGKFMPYKSYSRMTEDDLRAMFLYLGSLPALDSNGK